MNHEILGASLPDGMVAGQMTSGSARCPHCAQLTLLRGIALSFAHVRALHVMLSIETGDRLATADDMAKQGRSIYCNYTQLKYWELIRPLDDAWQLTELGRMFLRGEIALPRRVWVFNDQVRDVGFENDGYAYVHEIKTRGIKSRQEARDNSVPIEHTGQ